MSIDDALREQFALCCAMSYQARLLRRSTRSSRPAPKLASRDECSQYLGISARTLDTLRKQGLPVVMVLESPQFDLSDVRRCARRRAQNDPAEIVAIRESFSVSPT